MIKTPLSTAIGGVGFYTKNTLVIGGHKSEPLFDIASLFSGGEQGLWLDPHNLSTLFQDVGCTVPVTAANQTAGYVYDSSKPLVRRRNLLTDTELSNGLNSIYLKGGDLAVEAINGKNLLKIGNLDKTQGSYAYLNTALTIGKNYVFSLVLETVDGSAIDTRTDFGVVISSDLVGHNNYIIEQISSSKVKIIVKFVAKKATATCGVVKYTTSSAKYIYVHQMQMEAGEEATQYQAIDSSSNWVGKFGAYQVDSAKQAILGVDAGTGYKYLGFDGVDDFYITSAFALPQPFTVMIACETIKSSASQALFSAGQGGYLLMVTGGNYLHTQQLTGNPMLLQPKNVKDVLGHIAENGNVRLKTNLGERSSSELVSQNPFATLGEKYIGIFNPTSFGTTAGIKLYAMLVINRALTADEEAAVRREFNKRMGIAL